MRSFTQSADRDIARVRGAIRKRIHRIPICVVWNGWAPA